MLIFDEHYCDVCCDEFLMPQTDSKSKQVKEHSDTENSSVVAVIAADIATAMDSFHRITTATAVAVDVFDGRCSVGAPLTISGAAASNIVNSERL